MPKASSATAAKVVDHGFAVDRSSKVDGYTVNFLTLNEPQDITEVLASLSEGKCPCPHWGYLLAGRVEVRYDDGTHETFEPGDAFYWRPGHTSWVCEAGTEFVQFSPADLLAETDAAIEKAMQARAEASR